MCVDFGRRGRKSKKYAKETPSSLPAKEILKLSAILIPVPVGVFLRPPRAPVP